MTHQVRWDRMKHLSYPAGPQSVWALRDLWFWAGLVFLPSRGTWNWVIAWTYTIMGWASQGICSLAWDIWGLLLPPWLPPLKEQEDLQAGRLGGYSSEQNNEGSSLGSLGIPHNHNSQSQIWNVNVWPYIVLSGRLFTFCVPRLTS